MKREQVMAMTDSDLRIEVAKLTGATDFAYNPYDENRIQAYWPENDKGDGEEWREIPDYPNDIAAAWELVDYMGFQKEFDLELAGGLPVWEASWEASFMPTDGRGFGLMRGETAPRAITRAFILAMQEG